MIPLGYLAAVGMVAGAAAFVLGVAQITCEHAAAPIGRRISTGLLIVPAVLTAVDSWDAWAGADTQIEPHAILFCVALTATWAYRRVFRLRTSDRSSS